MGNISIELVPRDPQALGAELRRVRQAFPAVDTVNIPDLLKFPVRSWDGCCQAKALFPRAIPHLRAIDFNLGSTFPLRETLLHNRLDTVLIVAGDPPQDMSRRVFRTTSVELIRALKEQIPGLRVFAALDQYRAGIRAELGYVARKLEAGADGFFTQPFFDLRLLAIYHDLLKGVEVYWGMSPVTSARSRDYWENRNGAVFPPDFEPTMAWNRRFAAEALEFCARTGSNLYFMPISVGVVEYLGGILS